MLSRANTDGLVPASGYVDWLISQLSISINWGTLAVEALKLHTSRLSAQDMHYVLSPTLPYRPLSTDSSLAVNSADPKAAVAGKGAKAAVVPPAAKLKAPAAKGPEAVEGVVEAVPPPEAINIPLSTSLQRMRARIQCRLVRQKYHMGVLKNHHLSINGELSPGNSCFHYHYRYPREKNTTITYPSHCLVPLTATLYPLLANTLYTYPPPYHHPPLTFTRPPLIITYPLPSLFPRPYYRPLPLSPTHPFIPYLSGTPKAPRRSPPSRTVPPSIQTAPPTHLRRLHSFAYLRRGIAGIVRSSVGHIAATPCSCSIPQRRRRPPYSGTIACTLNLPIRIPYPINVRLPIQLPTHIYPINHPSTNHPPINRHPPPVLFPPWSGKPPFCLVLECWCRKYGLGRLTLSGERVRYLRC